jgi:hypothetical protein
VEKHHDGRTAHIAGRALGDLVKSVVDVRICPSQGNRSRGVDDSDVQSRIAEVVDLLVRE